MDAYCEKDRYDMLEERLVSALIAVESIIREKLDNYGIYYRIFARVKQGESIRQKLSLPRYREDPEKKLKDLIGIRVVLYYEDDIEVCKRIFSNMLEQRSAQEVMHGREDPRWEQYESTDDTFTATKINGVFELPGFIRRIVEPEIRGLRLEPTFEIQLRTMYFEGWHEVEHDMRYKNQELWENFPKESRKLNSVLATLEMCDHYMVTLFDDIGHDFYKKENWGEMIRYKYRLKTLNGELDQELEKLISVELGKKIFKWKKEEFIDLVLQRGFHRLDANVIVYLVNESLREKKIYCPAIAQRFENLYQEEKQKMRIVRNKNLAKLRQEKSFEAKVELRLSGDTKEEKFAQMADYIYTRWLKAQLGEIYPDEFAGENHPLRIMDSGIICNFEIDRDRLRLYAELSNVDTDEPAKISNVLIEVYAEGKGLALHCMRTIFKPEKAARTIQPYSRPKIYANIAREIGIGDVHMLKGKIISLKESDMEEFVSFLENKERRLPVVLLSYPCEEERFMKNSCYGRLVDYTSNPRINDQTHLMRKIAYVSHVYCITGKQAEYVAGLLHEDATAFSDGVRIFGKGFTFEGRENYQGFSREEICNHPKDIYALHARPPHCYMSVSGADAMRHEVIQMIYRENLR